MLSSDSWLYIMPVVCYCWDSWPVAVAIADVSGFHETFNVDGIL